MLRRAGGKRRRAILEPLEGRLLFTASELIRNGSFEGSAITNDWNFAGDFHADSTFPNPHSGLGYSYLADPTTGAALNHANGTMYQQVTVPASSTALTLNFWTYITTQEVTTTTQFDKLHVQVMDSTGTTQLADVVTLGNLNASSGYVQRSYTLPLSLAGQTVNVLFTGTTDGAKLTTFRVDDVGLRYNPLPTTQRVVGYMPGAGDVGQIDFSLLTWVNYSAMTVNGDGSLNTGSINATSLASVVTAAHAKGAGVSLVIIQPPPADNALSTLAADATARTAFAANVLSYIQSHNLDGVDIDYEPPATTATNQSNYALLIDSLYAALHPGGYNITSASNPNTHEIPVAATNEMDWINVMCYDFGYADVSPYSNSINGMNGWASYGVPKSKLVMGVPFYGRYGTSWSDTHAKSWGDSSVYTSTNHILSNYLSINGTYPPANVDSYTDLNGNTTYFNNIATMQAKMAFLRDNGFGGAMIWALLYDHWNTSNQYDQYSMLPVVSTMIRKPSWLTPGAGSTYDLVAGTFYLNSGSVTLSANAFTANPGLTLSLAAGTTATLSASQRISGLTVTGSGKLDIKNDGMIMDYSGTSPIGSWNAGTYSGLLGMVKSGRNGGSWNGSGIITSMTAAKSPSMLMTIGVAEASDALGISGSQQKAWNGSTVDATTILMRYTFAGDANLDGVINGDDYFKIDAHAGMSGGAVSYAKGDFNLDGKVNADDYFLIDSNYNKAQSGTGALPFRLTGAILPPAPPAETTADISAFDRLSEDLDLI